MEFPLMNCEHLNGDVAGEELAFRKWEQINHWTEEPSLESAQSVSKYPVMQNITW